MPVKPDNPTRDRRQARWPRHDPGRRAEQAKRLLDVIAAIAGLLMTGPLIVACGVWIRLCDGGPMFYRQWRVGADGWFFRIYKLRTMRLDAEAPGAARFAQAGDSRVLPGCAWMRRSHVDELPQLWNILLGDMSLVGPRPERPEMMQEMRDVLPGFERRLASKPGLTGLAQVRNGYTNDIAGMRRKLAYDIRYLRRRSLLGDLRLVFSTLPKVWDQAAL